MMVWMGPKKFCVVARAISRMSPRLKRRLDRPHDGHGLLPGLPLRLAPQQVLLGDHFQDRPDVLRHPAVDQHETVAQFPRVRRPTSASE